MDAPLEGRVDHAGTDCVGTYIVGGKILGCNLHEAEYGGLGDAVGGIGLGADLAGNRGEEEEGALAPGDHWFIEGMGGVDGAEDVYFMDAGPVRGLQVPEGEAAFA